MSDIHDFYRSIRETGAYATPPALGPRRPMRGGLAAALRFYVGALGGVVAQGTRTIRRNTFGVNTLGELAWRLMHAAECMGTEVSFEGFAAMRGIDQQPAVIVANHMSLVETMMLPAGVFGNGPMVIVAKRSLTRYPWFGRILEASRPILVNRRNPRQDLADVLEQGAQRHVDQLRHAIADEDPVSVRIGHAAAGIGRGNRLACVRQALLVGVGIGAVHVIGNGMLQMGRGTEAETARVADVELDQRASLRLQFTRSPRQFAADFVTDLGQALAGGYRQGGRGAHCRLVAISVGTLMVAQFLRPRRCCSKALRACAVGGGEVLVVRMDGYNCHDDRMH